MGMILHDFGAPLFGRGTVSASRTEILPGRGVPIGQHCRRIRQQFRRRVRVPLGHSGIFVAGKSLFDGRMNTVPIESRDIGVPE